MPASKERSAFYQSLLEGLTQRSFLKELQCNKKSMLEHLQAQGFRTKLLGVLAQPGGDCTAVLSACMPVLRTLCAEPNEGFLQYTYDLLLERLYPSTPPVYPKGDAWRGSLFLLKVLRAVLVYHQRADGFDPLTYFRLVEPSEQAGSFCVLQYQSFLQLMDAYYVLELMHIGRAIKPFDLLAHVAGVHHIAMHMARQLKRVQVTVDLPLVSAAAATHDIGKYGCKGAEMQRIPYLHYYYTEELLNRHDLEVVAHVAANHSTWDLELENLPVESLLLIYADFRVKSVWEYGRERILFYSLQESYDVILSKLDNVDEAKRVRYKRVYEKLYDFEQYMVSLGVNPDPWSDVALYVDHTNSALLHAADIVQRLKFSAISHNLRLMHKISADTSFADLLEDARSEKDWISLRTYINIFEEYFTYMTQKQKQLTMRFLYELFMHRQGDIRSQAATLYGRILAGYDKVYRKEFPQHIAALPLADTTGFLIWKDTLDILLVPDHKLAQQHRIWISYSLKRLLPSLLESSAPKEAAQYLSLYLDCFSSERYEDKLVAFVLLDSLKLVPPELLSAAQWKAPMRLARCIALEAEPRNQAVALRLALHMLSAQEAELCREDVQAIIDVLPEAKGVGVSFLLMQVYGELSDDVHALHCEQQLMQADIGDLFLDNLKTATPWMMKEINIEFLAYRTSNGGDANAFQVATHLVNLVRVSERFAVRHRAGRALVQMASMLTLDQRNEIAVELTRSMESASYEFSKYIPQYLGRFVLYLHPKELDEVLNEFEIYIKSANERAACIALPTLGVLLHQYSEAYREMFGESKDAYIARSKRMLSMLIGGMAHYNPMVTREAFLVIGKQVFGGAMHHEGKSELFALMYKKLQLLIEEQPEDTLTFFNIAASLNHIYRYIVDTKIGFGDMQFASANNVAFFPGTFDPFSSSHKAIVEEIRKEGFEVYLALDEFSWSKRTQPHNIRRRIVSMSVADMFCVYLFPDDIPVNIANPSDLARLRALFPQKNVYIAVGSDVIRNASAYKKPATEHSIHTFNHIVFLRNMDDDAWQRERNIVCSYVQGDVHELSLPIYLEDISSTRIRDNIDHNRDISMLVDPVAQGYIYDNGLYLREPQYKELLRPENFFFARHSPHEPGLYDKVMEVAMAFNAQSRRPLETGLLAEKLKERFLKPRAQLLALYNGAQREPLGIATYYATSAAHLFEELKNVQLAEYVRRHTSGRIAVIGGLFVRPGEDRHDIMQLLVTEMLAECLKEDYTYAVYIGADSLYDEMFYEALECRGFITLPETIKDAPVYAVDMRTPIALIEDVQQRIKSPLSHDPVVVEALRKAQQSITKAMTKLYPGMLVISFHSGVMNHSLIQKILVANHVENVPPHQRMLGECMCVPYGKTLRGVVVPNTVTKSLHADKAYMPDMKNFEITKYPGYSSLINQVRTIKSFNRPILLVDDLLHKGYRLEALDPLFKQVELDVKEIIVGILSGRGKDLMSVQGRNVESVYFIPNLRYWFVDSMLYPFLGGDSVMRPQTQQSTYLLPSVNQILPYTAPLFISGAPRESLYDLSLTCLNNARAILHTLERRHQEMFGYNLTLNRLGQAMKTARVPDRGGCVHYDKNLAPSIYVENDIEMLLRMDSMLR